MLPGDAPKPGGIFETTGGTDGEEVGGEAGVAAGFGGTTPPAIAAPGGEFGTPEDPADGFETGGPKPAGTPDDIAVEDSGRVEVAGELLPGGIEDAGLAGVPCVVAGVAAGTVADAIMLDAFVLTSGAFVFVAGCAVEPSEAGKFGEAALGVSTAAIVFDASAGAVNFVYANQPPPPTTTTQAAAIPIITNVLLFEEPYRSDDDDRAGRAGG